MTHNILLDETFQSLAAHGNQLNERICQLVDASNSDTSLIYQQIGVSSLVESCSLFENVGIAQVSPAMYSVMNALK